METILSKRKSGLAGIVGPAIAFLLISISILLRPEFSLPDNALSDLGAVGSSNNLIFNTGMVLSGLFGFIFSTSLPSLSNGKIGLVGSLFLMGGTASLMLIGIFPSGTSPHMEVSIGFFLLSAIGIIVTGIDQLLERSTRSWGVFSLSIALLGISSLILLYTIPYDLGAAIPELIGSITISEFIVVFGGRLYFSES